MSRVESSVFGFGDRLGSKEPSKMVDGPATVSERLWLWGTNLNHAGRAAYRDEKARWKGENRPRGIIEFGNSVGDRKDFPGIQGIDAFKDTLQSVVKSPRPSHILVVANHPELLRSGSQCPIWVSGMLSEVGKITGQDPHVFVKNEFVWLVGRWTNFLPVKGSKNNGGILEISRQVLLREKPQGFVIFPEGTSHKDDGMVEARSGGTLALMEAAVDSNVRLAVIPVALNQKLVSRKEALGKDQYEMHTGVPHLAAELFPPSYRGTIEERREVIHELMTGVAAMLPENRRGFYKKRVVQNREARDVSSGAPQVVFRGA